MRTIITIAILISFAINAVSQQTPQLSQRMFEPLVFNPGIAGSNSYPEIKIHHRNQWIGFDGAPMTSLISYHNEFLSTMGLGGYIMNDKYGAYRRTELNVAYAYHVPLKSVYVGFGISGGVEQFAINGDDLTIKDQNDKSYFEGSSDRKYKPDANFGIYIYNRDFYLGASVIQLLNSKVNLFESQNLDAFVPLTQHYYFIGGYTFALDKKYVLEPSFLVEGVAGSPVMADLNLKLEYKNALNLGLGYRYGDALVFLAGYRYDRYFIAYSYDLLLSPLVKSNSGSHEICIAFNWPYTPDTKPLYDLKGTERGQLKKRFR